MRRRRPDHLRPDTRSKYANRIRQRDGEPERREDGHDGSQSFEQGARFDVEKFVSVPIDLGPATDQVFLLLFGTGIRNNNGLTGVSATIGGAPCVVQFAGAQGGFAGLDQINLLLPRSLAGRGEADLILTVEGKQANTVRVNVK